MTGRRIKVLVCGGRTYRNVSMVNLVLGALHDAVPIGRVIHGGAAGADTLGGIWARQNDIPVSVFRADWLAHGKAAGPRRTPRLLDEGEPDLVVAFLGGRGTADMVKRAEARLGKIGLPFVMEVDEGGCMPRIRLRLHHQGAGGGVAQTRGYKIGDTRPRRG
jgi:hypothetical protein